MGLHNKLVKRNNKPTRIQTRPITERKQPNAKQHYNNRRTQCSLHNRKQLDNRSNSKRKLQPNTNKHKCLVQHNNRLMEYINNDIQQCRILRIHTTLPHTRCLELLNYLRGNMRSLKWKKIVCNFI